MKNRVKYFVIIVIVIALGFVGWHYFQRMIMFHPWNDVVAYHRLKNMDDFQEVQVQATASMAGSINNSFMCHGWLWDRVGGDDPAPLIIFFMGNAQNSSNTLYDMYTSDFSYFSGYNIMCVDYPGYGYSEDKPSTAGCTAMADAVYNYAERMDIVDSDNIVIMGYSIGTGVACYCASKHPAKGLILVSPYDDTLSLYKDAASSFEYEPITFLAEYRFKSDCYAKDVMSPVFILTSDSDEIISFEHSRKLSECFHNLNSIITVHGLSHNEYFSSGEAMSHIDEFLEYLSLPH